LSYLKIYLHFYPLKDLAHVYTHISSRQDINFYHVACELYLFLIIHVLRKVEKLQKSSWLTV